MARLSVRLRGRLRVGRLFGAVAPLRPGADGCGAGFCLATAALSPVPPSPSRPRCGPGTATNGRRRSPSGSVRSGAAFFLWDIGVKRGDIRLLGGGSYPAPVLSTLLRRLAGYAESTLALGVACALIVAGALAASVLTTVRR